MNTSFPEMARQAFSFLESAGFSLSQRDPYCLRYENERVIVLVSRDPRSGETSVSMGLQVGKGKESDMFSLTELLTMEDVDVPERHRPFQVYEESELSPFLGILAEDVRVHAKPVLAGDKMYFRRLRVFRDGQSHIDAQDMEVRRIRSKADEAWQKREFDKVVALYAMMEDKLTASEKMKLIYAKENSKNK